MKLQIDHEFQSLIPPLTHEEYSGLEASIKAEGCRDALVVWEGIVIDGHNRYEICDRVDIPFKILEKSFEGREDVKDWIEANQLSRRNLTPDQISLLRGRRYNRLKRQGERTDLTSDQNDTKLQTAERLAKEHGVSGPTIKRDGKVAAFLEQHPREAVAVLRGEKKLADVRREIKREAVIEKLEDISTQEVKEVQGIYDVIVIDPPWPMEKIERDVRPNQSEFEYPTMTEEALRGLEIPGAEDCHVWLWTTHKFLPMAFRLLNEWGLKYVCTFTWHKPGGFQPFGLPQYNCEFCLYARKGSPKFIDTKQFPVCFDAPRGAHSEKPDIFYNMVRRVTAGRRLDMFSRRVIEGFDGWGQESK